MSSMQIPHTPDPERRREAALQRYLDAFDSGDLDALADVLAEAAEDAELDRQIISMNAALHAEAGLPPLQKQAQVVRKLLFQHLPTGIPQPEPEPEPLTVGDVARRLAADMAVASSLSARDHAAAAQLGASREPVPAPVTGRAITQLAARLQVGASARFWEAFRRAALVLGIGRQQQTVQLAAARRQQGRRRRVANSTATKQDRTAELSEPSDVPTAEQDDAMRAKEREPHERDLS